MNRHRSGNLVAIPVIALLNVIAFFYQISMPLSFTKYWALVPARFTDALTDFGHLGHEIATLFTYQFLHGGLDHLLSNMILFVLLGRVVEREFGNMRFWAYYLASGVVGALGFYIFNAGQPFPLVGASGAISGVMGAFLILLIRRRVPFDILTLLGGIYIGFWLWDQVISSVVSVVSTTGDPVAYLAHLFGFICGAILTWRYCRRTPGGSTPFTLSPPQERNPWDDNDRNGN